jgi:endoglycosylceramidase
VVLAGVLLAVALACAGPVPGSAAIGPGGPGGPGEAGGPGGATGASGPLAPLGHEGRWLTDAAGRVVLLHGVNEVAKSPPYYPSAALGFGPDDAAFLADEGFNAVRLGVLFRAVMPAPGVVDHAYIEQIARTVDDLEAEGFFVLIDFHQDGFSPKYNGNGLPDWMAIDDGLPNPPDAVFPLYYVQNPAMQRAFESLWANRPGPDGVGLQDHFAAGVQAVARRLAGEPHVIGYDVINEPFPGADWQPCLDDAAGCAALEHERLAPFYAKVTAAVAEVAPRHTVFVEPFVLFNFGRVPTSLPGAGSGSGLSFHSYAVDEAGELGVVHNAVAAAERDGAPLLATEFGATLDPTLLDRIVGQLDGARVPWMMWAYNENIIRDGDRPAGRDNLLSLDALTALERPYPVAVTGTPTDMAFAGSSRTFSLSYDTTAPGGHAYPPPLVTVISVPELRYPEGYAVEVTGGVVTSPPCSDRLTVRTLPGAGTVTVRVTPGGCRQGPSE